MGDVADGYLAILGGVADVLRVGAGDVGKLLFEGVDDVAGFVERERGLGEIGDAIGIGHDEFGNFSNVGNNLSDVGSFAQSAFDLVVVAVANKDKRISLLGEFDGFDVDLGDQRARGVDDSQSSALAALANGGRNAVGGIDDALAIWNVVDFMNEDCAFFRQLIDDISVMDNFTADIDGSAEGFQSDLDDVDRAYYASAEASRLEQQDPLWGGGSLGVISVRDGIKQGCGHITQYTNLEILRTAEKEQR